MAIRRKGWDVAWQVFSVLAIVLWVIFAWAIVAFHNFELGLLIAATSCTILAVFCNRRKTRVAAN